MKEKRKRLTAEQRAAIDGKLKAHYANLSIIGKEYGVSRAYVKALAAKLGITYYTSQARALRSPAANRRRSREQRTSERAQRVENISIDWLAGKTCQQIADTYGYPEGQVQVASLIARLRVTHGVDKFPYRRKPASE